VYPLKNSIFNDRTDKEKVMEPMAQAVAVGLTEAARKALAGASTATCVKGETTSLRSLMKSAPLTGMTVRFDAGIGGSALILMAQADCSRMAGLILGREPGPGGALSAEAMEACLRFYADAIEAAGKSFAQSHGLAVRASVPELLNPDGRSDALMALADAYGDAVCLTFEIAVAGQPPCHVLFLTDRDARSSLQAQLAGYAAAGSGGSAASDASESRCQGGAGGNEAPQAKWNLDLILDVELEVAVSFGETQMALRDILKLGVGSVVELEKSVNDPVAILVNQKPIARGEVVMVDGNYAVKVLEVESTADRIRSLG
jgi:flagellar motor switch protein FliN